MSNNPAHHPSFEFIKEQKVESLNVLVQEFVHKKTGASHIHLSSDSDENVFIVALRTVPHDSTGVAHILEHTALCGSQKYPVRDPFFMMTRRSLNTFMNAFTSSDWTAYPFASMNRKDFNNLLDVYLDAVFFSRLDELDFAQEGHRLEFAEIDNPASDLLYKGVVFNEMKGAMSSVPSQLWQTLCKYMFPTNTYHFNSGGEPEDIPDLTYQQLLDFYKTHYHPSNAIFMTFGDIPAEEHQTKFENQALKHFDKLDYAVSVADEKRYYAPVKVQESYPNNDEDLSEKTHIVVGWLLGHSTDLEESMRAQLLTSVLLDNSASPLMQALETTQLGSAPSPLCGLDDSQKELTLMCGLAGCASNVSDEVEELILDVARNIVTEGIPQEDVESALHQLELHQREIGGDHYPYGLQIILTALTSATHRGDPVKLLNIDPVLEKLREEIKSPDFIKELVQKYILDNTHRVRLTLTPDAELNNRKELAEKQKLEKIKNNLSDLEKETIIKQAVALKERQENQEEDEEILPKVTLQDVPEFESTVSGNEEHVNKTRITSYATGTNGLVYQQAIFKMPPLPEKLLSKLSIYSNIVTELGVGDKSYLEIQKQQASVCGSFSGFSSIRGNIANKHDVLGHYNFSGKALSRNHSGLTELMSETINNVRFDEMDRIKELIAQLNHSYEQRITGNGHSLAMTAASSGICATAKLSHNLTGLEGFKRLKALNKSLQNSADLEELADTLKALHQAITQSESQILLIGEESNISQFKSQLGHLTASNHSQAEAFKLEHTENKIHDAWLTNSQVNFCAKSYSTVTMDHEDSAALVILGGFLRNGFLHTAIREQGGAYGGGASQDNNNGAFRFYSYRDPRLVETLDDFDASVQWLINEKHSEQKLEEAILGAISGLDSSESPAGKAKRCFHAELSGRTVEKRQLFRQRLLSTKIDDLKHVAEKYLTKENENTAVLTDTSQKDQVEALDFNVKEL